MSGGQASFPAIEARARSGDAAAQVALAQALIQMGRPDEARQWLDKGVAAGHAPAKFLLGRLMLEGQDASSRFAEANNLFEAAAAQGDLLATCALAVMRATGSGCDPSWLEAATLFLRAVDAGDRTALRQLAFLLSLAEADHPAMPALLAEAARKGDGLAVFALLRRHARGQAIAREDEVQSWYQAMAQRQHPLVAKVANFAGAAKMVPLATAWDRALLSAVPMRPLPASIVLSEAPAVRAIERLFTEEECDYIVGLAGPRLAPAMVIDPATGNPMRSPERSSTNAQLRPFQQDLAMYAIEQRLAAAAQIPFENGEMTSILRYRPGEEYRPHFDFLIDGVYGAAGFQVSGQRVATLLVCLNDEFEGGETSFLTAGVTWKGRTGDALLFRNVTADGKPDMTTRHAGLPVKGGEKWLLSKWYREKRFKF